MRFMVPVIGLILAVVVGVMVAGISQFAGAGARELGTPDASRPVATPSPTPELTSSPSSTASPTPSLTPTPVPTREIPATWVYTAIAGDSLSLIASRYQTTTEQLLQLNPDFTEDRNELQVGDQVVVPCTPIAVLEGRCG